MNLIAHYADTPTRGEEVANRMRKSKDFILSHYIGNRLRSIRTNNGAHYFFYRDSEVPSFQGMKFSGLIYHDEPPEKIRMELMARTVPADALGLGATPSKHLDILNQHPLPSLPLSPRETKRIQERVDSLSPEERKVIERLADLT